MTDILIGAAIGVVIAAVVVVAFFGGAAEWLDRERE